MNPRRAGSPAARDYAGEEDLRHIQRLAAECWRLEGPNVYMTIGDVAWQMYQHLDKLDDVRIRLWLDGAGSPLAWGWLWLPSTLVLLTHPRDRERLVEPVLAWFEDAASPGDGEDARTVVALESDLTTVAALERRGYRAVPTRAMSHMVRSLSLPSALPSPPPGYRIRVVRGDEDLAARADVHRAAFAPSRVVRPSYARLMREWPYRPDLDFVVEADDGSFAAFCLCWLDQENRMGELEPVGTHPGHRRRGLARAVCLAGLGGLRAAGAETALVYSVAGSPAESLYSSIGFEILSRHLEFRAVS
jgi:ribosomal protein S18 acetylase RimI-like enzyme